MSDPLTEIKQLYFRTSRATIQQDFDRAIDLLKSLASEEDRERVTVYMQGLAEMKGQWTASAKSGVRRAKSVRRAKFGGPGPTSEVRNAELDVRGPKSGVRSQTFERGAKPKPGRTR